MRTSLIFKTLLVIPPAYHALAAEIITPFGDSGCREAMSDATMDWLPSDYYASGTSIWHFTDGYPSTTNWENINFPSANSSYGGSGKEVWWKVPKLKGGCSVVLMEKFSTSGWGTVDPNQPPGNVIINTSSAGCLYSSLRDGISLHATYCCSDTDCYNLDPKKRAIALPPNQPAQEKKVKSKRHGDVATATASRRFRRDNKSFDFSKCKAVNTDKQPRIVPGLQGAITATTKCNSNAACSFSITESTTSGTTLSSSESKSMTDSMDTSIAVTAGVMFPFQASTTVSMGFSLAKTVGSSTGTDVSNSTQVSVQQGLNLEAGATGYLSFTPKMQCWQTSFDCGKGPVSGFSYCNPVLINGGPDVIILLCTFLRFFLSLRL